MGAVRRDLPRGTVTFVFTDIAGSTRLLRELGEEEYARALREHRELVRTAFTRHDGIEVDSQGDAFFFAFRSPQKALEAVSEGPSTSDERGVRVRIGIHTGTPLLTAEGYVGTDVHRASRIASAGHGGQVLVSATTATLVESDGFELLDLGNHRLKDLARPERLFQLGSGAFPPIRSLSHSNLPAPTTTFLGRQVELERLKEILASGNARVVTLTGPGGIGKTRLAVQAARESSDRFPDGRWWVPLGPLSDPQLVHSALASALAAEEPREALTASDPIARLATGSSLVLLDSAEHLLPSLAEELAPVVERAEGATFLVTSRAPLHLESEFEYSVPPMNPEDATSFLLSRAQAVGIELEPSAAQSRLCERLDHLPLAMQLVAAQLKVFTIEQLMDRLSNLLDVRGQRDTEPRHRTLRAAIEWSHSLLSPEQQQAFRRISIFPAGATAEALAEITETDVDTLFALLDASLLRRRDEDEPRFWMLQTIREFARERLEEADDLPMVQARHARFYRAMASRVGRALDGRTEDLVGVLDAEVENMRLALSWFLEERDFEAAQELVGSIGRYWFERGSLAEVRSWLDRSLSGGPRYGPAFAGAINRLSSAAYLLGEYELARTTAEEAFTAARAVGDPMRIQYALTNLANALEAMDLLDEAWPIEEEVLRICRGLRGEHPRLLTFALINISYSALIRGWYQDAVAYAEEAISVARESGDPSSEGNAMCNLAEASVRLGRVELAADQIMDAISFAVDLSDRLLQADCLEVLAAVEVQRRKHRSAARIIGMSEALRDVIGYPMQPAERALRQDTLGKIRAEIGENELATAWSEGARSDVEETLALLEARR